MYCKEISSIDLSILMKKIKEKEEKRKQKEFDKFKKGPSFWRPFLGLNINKK